MKILDQQETDICSKMLKIEVPMEDIDHELGDVYEEFMENASVPGFRKGKVPRSIAKMRFGKELRKEAVQKAMNSAFKKATEELDLDPIGAPDFKEIEDETKGEATEKDETAPLVFETRFEYRPRLESVDYKDVVIEPPSTEVSETEVMDVINHMREENAMFATIEDRPVAREDHVTISSEATVDGMPFPEATHNEIVVQLGTGNYIPGFEDALIGMKLDEEKEVTLTLPENHPVEQNRGKDATFKIKIKQIREKRPPELDDEFAKDLGDYQSLNDLKERVREDLARRKEMEKNERIFQSIREELLKRNSFDVPPSMVNARYNYINASQDQELRRMGTSLEAITQRDEQHLERNKLRAAEDVRLSIILQTIGKQEKIEITEMEFANHIHQVAHRYNTDPKTFMKRIESEGLAHFFREEALEKKVLGILRSRIFEEETEEPAQATADVQEGEENQSGVDTNGGGADK
ncbi:MAG: trigger factor [Candidatus Omnitrophota bacterium]|nr:MAG: trigger factor [Candidatus Omnitrophota bacterium]